jgi:hypothetical protein
MVVTTGGQHTDSKEEVRAYMPSRRKQRQPQPAADSKEEVRAYLLCRRKQRRPQVASLLTIRKR